MRKIFQNLVENNTATNHKHINLFLMNPESLKGN